MRRLRYFYGNTWVGDHALDFHGEPRRMLRGSMLVGLLLAVYSVAGKFSPTAGVIALVAVAGLMPALFQASMRFRLANTSWRGMRFHFTGTVPGAYRALVPAALPAVVFIAVSVLGQQIADAAPDAGKDAVPDWINLTLGLSALITALMVPFFFWRLKQYQHGHYALGRIQTQLRSSAKAFYGLFLRSAGVSFLVLIGVIGIGFGLAMALGIGSPFGRGAAGSALAGAAVVMLIAVGVTVAYLAMIIVVQSFLTARLQNLLWTRTKSTEIRFESHLRLRALIGLTLKNWLLMMLTLGFYWPFAAVAKARLRLEAITVYTRRPVEDLAARAAVDGQADAAGDAAGDLFGLDFGF